MVMFNTLESRLDEVQMSPENENRPAIIQEMQHAEDCTSPQITIEYQTASSKSIDSAYDNKPRIIAGCTCGSKVSIDATGSSSTQPSYSGSMEDKKGSYSVSAKQPEAMAYY